MNPLGCAFRSLVGPVVLHSLRHLLSFGFTHGFLAAPFLDLCLFRNLHGLKFQQGLDNLIEPCPFVVQLFSGAVETHCVAFDLNMLTSKSTY